MLNISRSFKRPLMLNISLHSYFHTCACCDNSFSVKAKDANDCRCPLDDSESEDMKCLTRYGLLPHRLSSRSCLYHFPRLLPTLVYIAVFAVIRPFSIKAKDANHLWCPLDDAKICAFFILPISKDCASFHVTGPNSLSREIVADQCTADKQM